MKPAGTAKIIIETGDTMLTAQAPHMTFHHSERLTISEIELCGIFDVTITPEQETPVNPTRRHDPYYSVPTCCPQETAMIEAAKAQERATLQAARIIEKAQEQAEAVINDADHTLNMAIQSFLHTGKTTTDVARVLDGASIYYNEVRGDNVAALNTEDLYLLDATELLTVG